MQDPTPLAISATFLGAFLLFILTAIIRRHSPPKQFGAVATSIYHKLDLIGAGLIFLVFAGLVISSLTSDGKSDDSEITAFSLIASIVVQVIFPTVVTCFVIRRIKLTEWLGLRWKKWPTVFLIGPGCTLAMLILLGILNACGYTQWIESFGVDAVQDSVKILQDSNDPAIIGLMAFAAVIVAPICEETLFRGYLYPVTKKYAGPWVGGICSAMIFTAAHGSLAALFPLFVFGLLLVFLYEKTGSIWAPISLHLCFNAATVISQLAERYSHLPPSPHS